jgi:UDPglucose--hexose-1-phosphate uridylyltransferase
MSELRLNIISKDWVIIASDRAKRPEDFKKEKQIEVVPAYQDNCPFCLGNENVFPNIETSCIEKDGIWRVKSIYNKYPALSPDKNPARAFDGLENLIEGFGVHEVVIEHPRHDLTIALMPDDDVLNILKVYVDRYRFLKKMDGIEAITIFKNQGLAAGASQKHPHSQIVATPIVPPQTRTRLDNAVRYFDTTGKCVFCHMLASELKGAKRIVKETEKFVSFVPFAAAAPFIIWIFPKRHMPSFADIDCVELVDMVNILKDALLRLYHGLDNPDFNYTIRSVPVNENGQAYFHWYLAIVPRIAQPAGFELGSGIFINTTIPEDCAKFLRQAQ